MLVSRVVDVLRALLPAPALPLLALSRFHSKGRTQREITCGFRACTVGTISNREKNKHCYKYLYRLGKWLAKEESSKVLLGIRRERNMCVIDIIAAAAVKKSQDF